MKKILFSLAVVASSIFAASCSKEQTGDNMATVSINVDLQGAATTKAFGSGDFAEKNLIVGVFDENGNYLFCKDYQLKAEDFTTSIEIQFRVGKTYQLAFWAQYGEAYGTAESIMRTHTIKANYTESNNEELDAFYAYVEPFLVKKDFSLPVTLTRPFAQINFATSEGNIKDSYADGNYLGVPDKAYVTISSVANTLDLLGGATSYVNGSEVLPGAPVTIPVSSFATGNFIEVENTLYEVLSMNYVLVSALSTDNDPGLVTADLTLTLGELDAAEPWQIFVPNANMKRNYKTSVVGQLLTAQGSFQVEIDPLFKGEYNTNWNETL